jgi:catechol 2,3-dioxygenase-like lactoylglutathione lyase family enzyme
MTFATHGRISCGTVVTPTFDLSLADYRDHLGLAVVETAVVPADLAAAWGCPASAGARMALLQPTSGAACFIRLIEGAAVPDYVPLRSYGWASLEITVENVWTLHERIKDSVFDVIGPPKLVEGFDTFIPMQVIGRAGEVLYLNQTLKNLADLDLPVANSPVDHIFIVILAAPDRAAAVETYTKSLPFHEGQTYTITYSVINQAFGLPDSYKTSMTMTCVGRLPGLEIDQYPPETIARPRTPGALPPGVAMVSLLVDSLDAAHVSWLSPPARRDGPLYQGRRSACFLGPAGELTELIEVTS